MSLYFTSNLSSLAGHIKATSAMLEEALQLTVTTLPPLIRQTIMEVYSEAVAISGLPSIYANHLRIGMETLGILINTGPGSIYVNVESPETLGDYSLIVTARHYGALYAIENKKDFAVSAAWKAEGAFAAEGELYEQIPPPTTWTRNGLEKRQEFWNAIVDGAPYTAVYDPENKVHRHSITYPTTGLFAETLNARVSYWERFNKYPEWSLLEYGQSGNPRILPTHFIHTLQWKIRQMTAAVFVDILYQVTNRLETQFVESLYGAGAGVAYKFEFTREGALILRGPGGRFAKYIMEE